MSIKKLTEYSRTGVWVLTDERAGNRSQAVGLAGALGIDYEVKDMRFGLRSRLHNLLVGASIVGLKQQDRKSLDQPWPCLVIAAGRRTAPVARWIKMQSGGRTLIVQLGRKGGQDPRPFDAVVTPVHAGLPAHPKRIETLGPLNRVSEQALGQAAAAVNPFAETAKPAVALLVGGATNRHQFGIDEARELGEQVMCAVKELNGALVAVTSPRTGIEATAALMRAIGDRGQVIPWRASNPANPYLSCLAHADIVVVTGDSESMIAEAAATGKAVFIYPLIAKPAGGWLRLGSWATDQAAKRHAEAAGWLPRICGSLIDRGLVRPPRNLRLMHAALESMKYIKIFNGNLSDHPPAAPFRETEHVAETLRTMLKLGSGLN